MPLLPLSLSLIHIYKATYPDGQCSSYDTEYCSWSNLPDDDWKMQDDYSWVIGEFVWTHSPRWNYSRIIPEAGMVMKKASGMISPLRQGAGKSFRSLLI